MLHEDVYERYHRGELSLEELFKEVNEKVVDEDLLDLLLDMDGVDYEYDNQGTYNGFLGMELYKYNLLLNGQQVAQVYNGTYE